MDFDSFSRHLHSLDRAGRTVAGYLQELELFAEWYSQEHGKPPETETVTPLDIKEWRRFQEEKGLSPATINRRLASLRAYFRWAKETGRIQINPMDGVRFKRQEKPGPKWLDRNQIHRLQNAAQARLQVAEARGNRTTAMEARRNQAILTLLYGAGLRLSELVSLKVSDVVLKERTGQVTVRSGKGNKWRVVPLNSDVRKAIEEWLGVRPSTDRPELLIGRKGEPLRPRGVERILKRLAALAGLDPETVTPHVLRHSFGKALVDAREGLEKVQALMGHESVVTTTRYTTPSRRDLALAVERIAWSEDG